MADIQSPTAEIRREKKKEERKKKERRKKERKKKKKPHGKIMACPIT